tara:strand:- start:488 stop:1186 length:699 start_codon:yes stop_codon:yes gene_type:complete
MASRLYQYRSVLTAQQVADGMNLAMKNARRLANDAELLLSNDCFPTAASVATLSIEESGKMAILRRLSSAFDDKSAKPLWKEYRSHTAKNQMWILPQLFAQGASQLREFVAMFDESADHPKLLDQIKQIGFYTDCLGNVHWTTPDAVIDEELAKMLVQTAKILAGGREIVAAEIELWIKHVGPHLDGSQSDAEAGLKQWYEEMQHIGLCPAGDNAMQTFIEQGIITSKKDGV